MRIALVGNPNVGKTSFFNLITNQNKRVGNYAGVTVGLQFYEFLYKNKTYELVDLPGTYNLYPESKDEEVVFDVLQSNKKPDKVVVVADATDIKKSMLLLTQIADMGFDVLFLINKTDQSKKRGVTIDFNKLQSDLKIPVFGFSTKIDSQKEKVLDLITKQNKIENIFFDVPDNYKGTVLKINEKNNSGNTYLAWQYLLTKPKEETEALLSDKLPKGFHQLRLKTQETVRRFDSIKETCERAVKYPQKNQNITVQLDKVLMHKLWGYLIFGTILLLIFQCIYTWASYPMEFIDELFMVHLLGFVSSIIPGGLFLDVITQGILPGLAGVFIFIPQIFFLFLILLVLEKSGYMSRVVYLMDKWLRPFGLNGKSVVPLISGVACAIPAIMATRNIESKKQRLITILVTPFMTCSARLPVYLVLISLVIPNKEIFGIELQALCLLGLYVFGLLMALLTALALKFLFKSKKPTYLALELPAYELPRLKTMLRDLWVKLWDFLWGAGRIIFALSIIMWLFSRIGWNDKFTNTQNYITQNASNEEQEVQFNSLRLENSLLGFLGRGIEPTIEPLGYDWKIGVAIITSFAAREVFVGTLSTIYGLNKKVNDEEFVGLIGKMKKQINPKTGKPIYNTASGVSLLLFYALAMQCMSTLAIVKRETNSWKWPIFQLVFMTVLAYSFAFIAFQILN